MNTIRKTKNKIYDYQTVRSSWFVVKRNETKRKLIELKGGKCKKCGYDKPILSAYDFHHRNPDEKSFGIGGNTNSFDKILIEAEKCDLLCKNCHAEVEEQINKERVEKIFLQQEQILKRIAPSNEKPDIDTLKKMVSETNTQAVARYFNICPQTVQKWKKRQKKHCIYCNIEFSPKTGKQQYCGYECNRLNRRKAQRPNKAELSKMIREQSWVSIGRKYCVSDNAVRKWAKQYNIL